MTASVPFMITQDMKRRLRDRYSLKLGRHASKYATTGSEGGRSAAVVSSALRVLRRRRGARSAFVVIGGLARAAVDTDGPRGLDDEVLRRFVFA